MVFSGKNEPASSARNVFHGRVMKIQPMGMIYRIQIDCGFMLIAHVTLQAIDDLHLTTGMQVVAAFKATSVHVIRSPNR
jgi:molybdopterin-binding protein